MGDRGHVGVINPDGTVSIRYVHSDANLQYLPFAIARIWWATFDRDTTKTIAALLEHDWADLDPTTQTDSKTWAGDIPVPGVGMRIEPLTEGPITGRPELLPMLHGPLFLFDPAKPGFLVITPTHAHKLTAVTVFELSVGETVVIEQR